MKIAICLKCGLNFGRYMSFHYFSGNVRMETYRHNCNLIRLAGIWDREVYYMPFYTDPAVDQNADYRLVIREREVTEAKRLLRAHLAKFKEAEIEACAAIFAAANAFRDLRRNAAWSSNAEHLYVCAMERNVDYEVRDFECPPSVVIEQVVEQVARELAMSHGPVNEDTVDALRRAQSAVHIAGCARINVAARFDALQRTMEMIKGHAIMAGIVKMPENPDVRKLGEIFFIDQDNEFFEEFAEGLQERVMDAN